MKPRRREQDVYTNPMYTSTMYYVNNVLQSTTMTTGVAASNSDVMDDIVGNPRGINPCFRKKQAFTTSSSQAVFQNTSTKEKWVINGDVTNSLLAAARDATTQLAPIVYDPYDDMQLVIQKAIAKIDKTPYAFGEDIAEFHKTVELLTDIMNPINGLNKRLLTHYRKAFVTKTVNNRTFRHLRKDKKFMRTGVIRKDHNLQMFYADFLKIHAEAAASAWLSYRFAYGNVLRSGDNAMQAFIERNNARSIRRKAVYRTTIEGNRNYDFVRSWNNGTCYDKYHETQRWTADLTAGIYYEDTNPILDYHHTLGLRRKDIIPTLWQIVPASWVVDRFVNISDSIKAFSNLADPSIKVSAGWTTVHIHAYKTLQWTGQVNTGTWIVSGTGNVLSWKDETITRLPWQPTYEQTMPQWNVDTSLTSVLDTTAFALKKLFSPYRLRG